MLSHQVYLDDTKLFNVLAAVTLQWDLEKWPDTGGALCDSLRRNRKSCLGDGWSCHVQQYRLAKRQFFKEEPWTHVDELLSVGSQ